MRCALPITLMACLVGCGLTRGETANATMPRTGSPANSVTAGVQVPAPVPTESQLFRLPAAGENPGAVPTSSAGRSPRPMANPLDGSGDGRLAQASPTWVDMGGALQLEEDAAVATEDDWELFVRPYAWLPKISGSVTVEGSKSRLVITQGTIASNLQSALLGRLEARKDDTFIILDTIGFAIGDDIGIPGVPAGKINVRVELALVELDTGVVLFDDGEQEVEAFVGARYLYIYTRINPKNVGIKGQSGSVDWVDPIIGSRYHVSLPDKWEMMLHADYGGFGVGSASDVTYQLMALFERQATERLNFGLGYRYLVFDHSQGSGTGEEAQYFRFSGPVAGLSYRF